MGLGQCLCVSGGLLSMHGSHHQRTEAERWGVCRDSDCLLSGIDGPFAGELMVSG